jgi:LysM repeat protein
LTMKKMLLTGIILINCLFVSAQHLEIEKERSLLYITHKVAAKETLYSLGRMYNLSPKVIASTNKLKADAGIQIGQQIKIPLKKENFLQVKMRSKKGVEPVYHTIGKGDNLYKLSKNYNHVKEDLLKKWNNISKNTIKPGQQIIVGYLKYNSAAEPIAKRSAKEEMKLQPDVPPKQEVLQVVKPDQRSTVVPEQPKTEPIKTTPSQELTKTETPKVAQVQEPVTVVTPATVTSNNDGYFAANYSVRAITVQEKKLDGTAATFKSTSGWSDKKYYVLINDIAPETIVKITVNGKSVFAKVLESLPDLKDNKGLICRLSNAAASALGITDAKFNVEISFYE